MQIRLKYHRPALVCCCCVQGAYCISAPEAWEKMRAYVRAHDLRQRVVRAIGCYMDDPTAMPAAEIRYTASIDIGANPPSSSDRDVYEKIFSGGVYASLTYVGDATGVGKILSQIKREWLPGQPIEVDPMRPFIEIYDTSNNLSYHGDFAAELGIPVLTGDRKSATAGDKPANE